MRIPTTLLTALLALLLLVAGAGPAAALSVQKVRFGQHPDKIRMVLELSGPAAFRALAVDNPGRLLIDLPAHDWLAEDVSLRAVPHVAALRQGPLQPGVSRLVVELNRPAQIIGAFTIPAQQGLPDRLVIDFKPAAAADPGRSFGTLKTAPVPVAQQAAPASIPDHAAAHIRPSPGTLGTLTLAQRAAPPPAAPDTLLPGRKPVRHTAATAAPPPLPAALPAAPPDGRKPVIVIDAGHGGVDPGAIGANGIQEKNITLAMARELKAQLEATDRYTVHLTRDSDKFLRLYQRVAAARDKNADLFISLHADSIGKGNVSGASIYTLSETASDRETAELAERENKVDLIAGADLSHADRQIAQILVGMSMRDTMNQSKFFANTIVGHLRDGGHKLLDRPHRYAGFAVLKAPDVPSVLIEIGFMSNSSEVRKLSDPAHREKLGHSLARAIDAYFEKISRNSRT